MNENEIKENKINEFKEIGKGDIIKLEKGQCLIGKFINIEESNQYADSYLIKVMNNNNVIGTFVSKIVYNMILDNSITKNDEIKIEFLGLKETKDGRNAYKDYKLYTKN